MKKAESKKGSIGLLDQASEWAGDQVDLSKRARLKVYSALCPFRLLKLGQLRLGQLKYSVIYGIPCFSAIFHRLSNQFTHFGLTTCQA